MRLKSLFYISKKLEYVASFLLILGDIIHSLIFKSKQMNTKMLIGGVLGGIVYFLLGWLVYGIIFADSMGAGACMRAHDAVLLLWIFIGNVFIGLMLSYVFSRMATVTTFGSGAMAGAIIGLLSAIGIDSLMYGTTTNMESPTHIFMGAVTTAVMWGIVGGAIGWWLGRGAGGSRGVASASQ